MRKNNNKTLYEKIMQNVSKQVKKALNENDSLSNPFSGLNYILRNNAKPMLAVDEEQLGAQALGYLPDLSTLELPNEHIGKCIKEEILKAFDELVVIENCNFYDEYEDIDEVDDNEMESLMDNIKIDCDKYNQPMLSKDTVYNLVSELIDAYNYVEG